MDNKQQSCIFCFGVGGMTEINVFSFAGVTYFFTLSPVGNFGCARKSVFYRFCRVSGEDGLCLYFFGISL
jgi:hypothetical protein